MNRQPRVLVTATGSAIAHGIIKSLKSSKYKPYIVGTDVSAYAQGLYRTDAGYQVPLAKENDFLDKIIDICKIEKIDIIFIGTDYELEKFAKEKQRIEEETRAIVVVSDLEVIQIANDKWLTYKFLKENHLPYIPSALWPDVSDLIDEVGFPLIVKPCIGDSSKDIFIVNNSEELNEKMSFLEKKQNDNEYLAEKSKFMVQKYLPNEDQEFTSSVVVFDGKCFGSISMQREMRFGGHTTKAVIEDFSEINQAMKKIAEKLKPMGPCNFQSRLIDGVPYIFEINCRYSGTTGICSLVGFNHTEAVLDLLLYKTRINELSFRTGTVLRYFNEVFVETADIDQVLNEKSVQHPKSITNNSF